MRIVLERITGEILIEGDFTPDDRYKMIHELTGLLKCGKVDLISLNKSSIELKYNIISGGRLLYQKSVKDRVEFESNTLSRYFDYLPFLREQRQEIISGVRLERGIQRYREALRKTERVLAEIRTAKR